MLQRRGAARLGSARLPGRGGNDDGRTGRKLTLMRNLEDLPGGLRLALALVRRRFGVLHLVGKLQQRVLDLIEPLRRRLLGARRSDRWHGCGR